MAQEEKKQIKAIVSREISPSTERKTSYTESASMYFSALIRNQAQRRREENGSGGGGKREREREREREGEGVMVLLVPTESPMNKTRHTTLTLSLLCRRADNYSSLAFFLCPFISLFIAVLSFHDFFSLTFFLSLSVQNNRRRGKRIETAVWIKGV